MLRWAPYPFVRITLGFIAGILLYLNSGRDFSYSAEVLAFFVAAYLVAFLLARRYKSGSVTDVAGILGLLCFVAGGLWATHLHTELHAPNHLLHLQNPLAYYVGVVDDYVVQKPGYQRTVLELEQVQVNGIWQPATGKVQLSVPHDSEQPYELTYGDRLLVKGAPQPVPAAQNPNQFDYGAYLANRNIFYRQFLQAHEYVKLGSEPGNPVLYLSIRWRRQLEQLLREKIPARREYAISSALILGVTDELDNAIKAAYINTGTMHVLSVSGLHVGLIYGVMMLVLVHFRRTPRQRLLAAIVAILGLWFYAFMTGLSPSVLRSVVMFTLVTVALASGRRTNIYNTLAIAAFALLLYNPYFLLNVGFQLSFLAVLGIVYFQPRFYRLLAFDNQLLNKLWLFFTVSLAAQLVTLPLGLLYFHQFPVYFWLANMVVVPLSTLALYTGLTALALVWIPVIGPLLFKLHFGVIWCMNELNTGLTHLPLALINGIDISLLQTVLLYVLLILVILFLSLKKLRYLALATVVVAILAGQEIAEVLQQKQQQTLAIYNVRRATGIALVQGQQATMLADSVLLHDEGNYTYNIQPHLWHLGVPQPQFVSLEGTPVADPAITALPDSNRLVVWQGQRLLILSHPPKLQPKSRLPLDYILLRNNVRLRSEDLQSYTSEKVILDASNSLWYRQRLHRQLDTLGIAYYDVADSGAFVLELGSQY
ncbi:ComEC family competence protein [Pontibacter sp. 172403-2]|uniref:ComEC/Rec2 family competence protein n=1 Tax=Pontibacter rufus TaxID=2791028 RepID=UPI0018AF9DDA|nr:ComEC/Rec2 family competence protein [Pontibacter sp. 172403-2]MBF9255149.1 ComEC family competence protein [Pontibacter sp. 172403-2]